MDKVYQVVEGFYFIGEIQERLFGTYSTMELAEKRKLEVINTLNVDPEHTFIKEIMLDVDIND